MPELFLCILGNCRVAPICLNPDLFNFVQTIVVSLGFPRVIREVTEKSCPSNMSCREKVSTVGGSTKSNYKSTENSKLTYVISYLRDSFSHRDNYPVFKGCPKIL